MSRPSAPVARLTAGQVLAWRMGRQGVHPVGDGSVAQTARAMVGAQAQVQSWAELSIALRRRRGRVGDTAAALAGGEVMRTWAMRGTLHVLDPRQAGALLALLAVGRRWERPTWQRWTGLGPREFSALVEATRDALDGRALDRDQLIDEITRRTGSEALETHLRSGWGGVLKPLAWLGHLCNGPARGGRVTFTRPSRALQGWRGLPPIEEAARIAVPAYLSAHGPADAHAFRAWMGHATIADARHWFALAGDLLAPVEVDGRSQLVVRADLDELRGTSPARRIRLLAGFDHYLLGPGTADARVIAPQRRAAVSRTAGWISPTVLAGGRVAGVWALRDERLEVTGFSEVRRLDERALEQETRRVGRALGRELALSRT